MYMMMVTMMCVSRQERSHADTSAQKAVRVQGQRMRKVVLRRAVTAPAHGEPSPSPAVVQPGFAARVAVLVHQFRLHTVRARANAVAARHVRGHYVHHGGHRRAVFVVRFGLVVVGVRFRVVHVHHVRVLVHRRSVRLHVVRFGVGLVGVVTVHDDVVRRVPPTTTVTRRDDQSAAKATQRRTAVVDQQRRRRRRRSTSVKGKKGF